MRALEPGGGARSRPTASEAGIAAGRSQFAVRVLPAEEFPRLPEPAGDAVTLDAAAFADALRQVVRAASSDDARPILTGVLMAAEAGGPAPGGHRLLPAGRARPAGHQRAGRGPAGAGAVPGPGRAGPGAGRGAEQVTLRLGARQATFEVGRRPAHHPPHRGRVPELPPAHPQRATPTGSSSGKEPLLDAVRRVKLLAREATPVRLALRPDGLELTAVTQDVGQAREDLDAKYEGAEMIVAFNPDYLIDGVEATPGDEVRARDPRRPQAGHPAPTEGADFLYLLMPVRVS